MTACGHKILHFGPGAFFRAFCLPVFQRLNDTHAAALSVSAVSLKTPSIRDRLAAAGWRYHCVEQSEKGIRAQEITCLHEIIFAPDEPERVLALFLNSDLSLVTLTITEKGYCAHPHTGMLAPQHPDIIHDISCPDRPVSAIGFLVAGLRLRWQNGLPGLTILSCDNLSENGKLLQSAVCTLAAAQDSALASWIDESCIFPSSVVDRIVPAVTQEDIDTARKAGIDDPCLVLHEPYHQWVIQDTLMHICPIDLTAAGAELAADIIPCEMMKLRCLNAAHSALAYLGSLSGIGTVAEAVRAPHMREFLDCLWTQELIPSFAGPEHYDPHSYCSALLNRFENPSLAHRTLQIASDGSQKLPQRIIAPLMDNLAADRPVFGLCLVLAAWLHFLAGRTETGDVIEISDPLAKPLRAAAHSVDPVKAVLGLSAIIPPALAAQQRFIDTFSAAYDGLSDHGVAVVLRAVTQSRAG